MKVLKIEDNHGLFLRQDDKFCNVTTISAQDVIYLLNCLLDHDQVEMDDPANGEAVILQPAEKIIYERMYQELSKVNNEKHDILEEIDSEYQDAYGKYITENLS